MIVDTSGWIEFPRPEPSRAGDHLEATLRRQDPVLVPETVLMELLCGTVTKLSRYAATRGPQVVSRCGVSPAAGRSCRHVRYPAPNAGARVAVVPERHVEHSQRCDHIGDP